MWDVKRLESEPYKKCYNPHERFANPSLPSPQSTNMWSQHHQIKFWKDLFLHQWKTLDKVINSPQQLSQKIVKNLYTISRVLEPHNYYKSILNAGDPQRRKVFKGHWDAISCEAGYCQEWWPTFFSDQWRSTRISKVSYKFADASFCFCAAVSSGLSSTPSLSCGID